MQSRDEEEKERNLAKAKRRKLTLDILMYGSIGVGGLAVDIIILGIWYGTDPFHWTTTVIATDFQGIILSAMGQCSSEGENSWVYPMVIVILHLLLLICQCPCVPNTSINFCCWQQLWWQCLVTMFLLRISSKCVMRFSTTSVL